jgi:hypothetical protein
MAGEHVRSHIACGARSRDRWPSLVYDKASYDDAGYDEGGCAS